MGQVGSDPTRPDPTRPVPPRHAGAAPGSRGAGRGCGGAGRRHPGWVGGIAPGAERGLPSAKVSPGQRWDTPARRPRVFLSALSLVGDRAGGAAPGLREGSARSPQLASPPFPALALRSRDGSVRALRRAEGLRGRSFFKAHCSLSRKAFVGPKERLARGYIPRWRDVCVCMQISMTCT